MATLEEEDTRDCTGSDGKRCQSGGGQTKEDTLAYKRRWKSDVTGKALEKLGQGLKGSFNSVAQGLMVMVAVARNPAAASSTTKEDDLDMIERRYQLQQKWWEKVYKTRKNSTPVAWGERVRLGNMLTASPAWSNSFSPSRSDQLGRSAYSSGMRRNSMYYSSRRAAQRSGAKKEGATRVKTHV